MLLCQSAAGERTAVSRNEAARSSAHRGQCRDAKAHTLREDLGHATKASSPRMVSTMTMGEEPERARLRRRLAAGGPPPRASRPRARGRACPRRCILELMPEAAHGLHMPLRPTTGRCAERPTSAQAVKGCAVNCQVLATECWRADLVLRQPAGPLQRQHSQMYSSMFCSRGGQGSKTRHSSFCVKALVTRHIAGCPAGAAEHTLACPADG